VNERGDSAYKSCGAEGHEQEIVNKHELRMRLNNPDDAHIGAGPDIQRRSSVVKVFDPDKLQYQQQDDAENAKQTISLSLFLSGAAKSGS
jgi:hypothetical protein